MLWSVNIGLVADRPGLTDFELMWLIAWNIAGGEWSRVDLGPGSARELLLTFLRDEIQTSLTEAWQTARVRLQHCLMVLQRGTFEEIQHEAPFSEHARHNMEVLTRAFVDDGERGFGRAWEELFRPGWEGAREPEEPITILVDTGDSPDRALEVMSSPDLETRVAAEWWWLYYTYGRSWKWETHFTTTPEEDGTRFSLHYVHVFPNFHRQVYFRIRE